MSESRNDGESRGSWYTPSYSPSESRVSGESRYSSYTSSYVPTPSESREVGESRYGGYSPSESREDKPLGQGEEFKYNNLDSIDELIEKLEVKESVASNSARVNKALDKRRKKIEELKLLRKQLAQKEEEERRVQAIEKDNDELDKVIDKVKQIVKKPISFDTSSRRNCNFGFDDFGESRDSGESNW